jgi:hypothetical protein
MSWHDATVNSLPPLAWPPAAVEDGVDATAAPPQPLGLIEARLPPRRPPPPEGGPRMLLWHANPAPAVDAAAQLLLDVEPAVAFVAAEETVPVGGRPRLIADLARRTGCGHVLAVSGLAPRGAALALASLALLSPHVLYKLGLERLPGAAPTGGVGSPVALLAQLEVDGVPTTLAAVRLVAGRGPEDRARQVAALLDRIDLYDRHLPVLIAGDLVTTTLGADAPAAPAELTPDRLLEPEPYEPMFELFRRRGYAWRAGNVPRVATGRLGPWGDARPPAAKRLWFLARGLVARAPAILPAPGSHDALSVRVGPS